MKRTKIAIVGTLLLAACIGSDEVDLTSLRSAQSGMRVSMEILKGPKAKARTESAVSAGALSGTLFSDTDTSSIEDADLPRLREVKISSDTQLIDDILSLLKTNIQELLNRSTNRVNSLDSYLASMELHLQEAKIRQRALESDEEDLSDDQRRIRRIVRDLQNELDEAISLGEGRSATILTEELVERQTALGKTETDLIVTERLLKSFEEIIRPLENRLNAAKLNREALVKGVRVFDTRGVEDLGIIEVEEGFLRRRGRR